jgi:hypothetical protein
MKGASGLGTTYIAPRMLVLRLVVGAGERGWPWGTFWFQRALHTQTLFHQSLCLLTESWRRSLRYLVVRDCCCDRLQACCCGVRRDKSVEGGIAGFVGGMTYDSVQTAGIQCQQ